MCSGSPSVPLLSAGINVPGRFLAEAAEYIKSFAKHNMSYFNSQELFSMCHLTMVDYFETEKYMLLGNTASECIGCRQCESRCPFGVPIADRMKKAAELFGK